MADSEASIEKQGGEEGSSTPVPEVAGSGSDSGVIEEASPDSLKNTPSNIARLEDVIEHCAARRKYLAQTPSPSDGGDVRWFFCKVPLADDGTPLIIYILFYANVCVYIYSHTYIVFSMISSDDVCGFEHCRAGCFGPPYGYSGKRRLFSFWYEGFSCN